MKENKTTNQEKSLKKIKSEKASSKIITTIKKRWLVTKVTTLLLIAILVAIFIAINILVKKWSPTAIDCTTSKDFSLTEESKEKIKDIDKEIKIYFVGWQETAQQYILAQQYNKANSKIKIEIVDITKNQKFAKNYNLKEGDQKIIVANGDISRTIEYYDIFSYDSSGKEVDISEQKITSAILNITAGKIPKAYFLAGYTSLSFENGLQGLSEYLKNEVLEIDTLNILNTQKVPEDCDTLIIMTPEKDFDTVTTNSIMDYIKKGGNILWLNGVYIEKIELKNVNKILSEYGINPFEVGCVYETNKNNTVLGYQTCFMPTVQSTEVTNDISTSAGVIFLNPTKININTDKLDKLKVTQTTLIESPDTTYFTTDVTGNPDKSKDTKGTFVLGTKMTKTITEADEEKGKKEVASNLIIYGNDFFITDQPLQDMSGNTYYMIYLGNNADLGLNSIANLTNRDQDITIRKTFSDSKTTFTATDGQKKIVMIIIFAVPILIIIIGIIIWVIRRRRR